MWREKPQDKLWINSLFIKSITIILVYVSRLKKNLPCISLLSHTLIIFLKCGNTLLSPFYFLLHALLSLDCLLFSKWLTLGCSFFFFFFGCGFLFLCTCTYSLCVLPKAAALYSLIPLAFFPNENHFYSLLVSHFVFLSPNGGPLGQSQQILCSIVYL